MSAADLLRAAAQFHGVTVQDICSPSQRPYLVPPRREVAIALRAQGWSLTRIGNVLGHRHHTSVRYYLQTAVSEPAKPLFNPDQPDYSGEWAI